MEEFDRAGDPNLRRRVQEEVASRLGAASYDDVMRILGELRTKATDGRLNTNQVEALDSTMDSIQELEAFDHPWVFGQRYMSHRFVSTDPSCPNCKNAVPHRTILMCPTCGIPGPWESVERVLQSSYVHYLLVEQARRLISNSLMMPDKLSYADGALAMMPRGGAKSTWLCEIMTLWLVLTKRSHCCLLVSNTIKQVTERALEIKNELEQNDKIIRDFGSQEAARNDTRVWSHDDFVLDNGTRVVARGALQSMRGVKNKQYRPDVVIGDDIDDDKFMTTSEQARKLWEWWDNRVIPACHPNAVYMPNGTVLGEMALLWQIASGHRGTTYIKRTFKALRDEPGCSVCGLPAPHVGPMECLVCGERTEAVRPSSYWGARFTVPALHSIRQRIGHFAWQTEYEQSPHDSSATWFQREWLEKTTRDDLAPLPKSARRVIPWSAISCSLSGEEAVLIAEMADPSYARVPGDLGPYQVIIDAWDPAWARAKPKDQQSCYMAGIGMGLTWDDKLDIFTLERDRGLAGTAAYREWMYKAWVEGVQPIGNVENPQQVGMIIERNGGGILFQYGVEEHWSSIPLIDHQTGAEKHDLIDGLPGLASWVKDDRVIIRAGGNPRQRELADELVNEMHQSARSLYTDMVMATWIGWAYINRWIRDVRDPARYDELSRRRAASLKPHNRLAH